MPMFNPSPRDMAMLTVARWEGPYGDHPNDPMNWVNGQLIGTGWGVTPPVLARHRGVNVATLTRADMQSVTIEEAGDIAKTMFYDNEIDEIRWNAAACVVMDFGWGAGVGQAVKSCERDFLHINNPDNFFDPASSAVWAARCDRENVRTMEAGFTDVCERFYDMICERNPSLAVFRQGWHNRRVWTSFAGKTEWAAVWEGDLTVEQAIANVRHLTPSTLPKRVLSKGMIGKDVVKLQEALIKEMPTLNIRADGIFGDRTDAAVRAFQTAHPPLQVDGWVGNATRKALGLI